jgi:hypothetical protein
MNSLPIGHDSFDAPSTSSGAQPAQAADESSHHELNPLWAIAAAMAFFFAVAAAFLAAG